jgi:endonuclease VIII
MPEGHTLHRLARLHQKRYGKRPVGVTSPQGRFPAAAVDGRVLVRAEAYGKHLFHVYGPDAIVHVHLGLYGTFTEFEVPTTLPVGQVRMRMVGETHWTDLRGPTRCEVMNSAEQKELLTRLGPDPLRRNADPSVAYARITKSKLPVAALLMEQKVLAGVGNVYRAELLFRHKVNPQLPGRALDEKQWSNMWADLVKLMKEGVRKGRIDTVNDEHLPHVTGRPPRKDRHGGEVYVYRRTDQPCLVCGTPVRKADLAARNLYWCPTCQA